MRALVLLAVLSAAAWSMPAMAQTACAYGTPRDCFDGRDITERKIRDDLTNRTKGVAVSTLDITDRKNRDDLTNQTKGVSESVLDITDRKNRDDLANRTKIVAVSTADITDRKNRDDLTDRTLACP
jgi:Mg2+/Co2+ transporter CorC